jgi:hypothetical protein
MIFWSSSRIVKPLEAANANPRQRMATRKEHWHSSGWIDVEKGIRAMTRTLEAINDAVRNPKHPFRKTDNQPKKSLKHRYERRKIKEYLHLGDWLTEEAI